MKKLSYLIALTLILGLVLAGCTLLSNISQVPTTNQSEVSSIVKNLNNTNMKCVNFEGTELNKGDSVEGMGTVHPLLNIQLEGAVDLVLIENGTDDISNVAYYAGAGTANSCLYGTYGFGCPAFDSNGDRIDRINENDKIIFEFPDGITVSNFSVEMFDYGDFYPYGTGDRLVTLKAYSDSVVEISYSGPAGVDPTYDACHSSGNGIHKFETSGSGIYKIELVFGTGIDPAIGFDYICFTIEQIVVPLDIKPTSCPNPLNTKSKGVTPVAVLGTADFDVTLIDPITVTLAGAYPISWNLEDVATPFVPYIGKKDCDLDCNNLDPDGYLDLTLKFYTQELLDAIELLTAIGTVESFEVSEEELDALESGVDDQVTTVTGEILDVGDCLVIQLEGSLFDGTHIIGEDVVRILKKGNK